MADKKKMSVEEVLAACRRLDGGGGEAEPGDAPAAAAPQAAAPAEEAVSQEPAEASSPPAAPSTPSKPAGQMSVQEILAAARAEKAQGGPAAKPAAPAGEAAAASKAPAAKGPAAGKKPGEMSVAEMLAAARAEKSAAPSAPAAKAASPKAPAKAKPAATPAAATAKATKKPAEKAGPKETASILAAARKPAKPGPITKAEAAARAKAVEAQAAKAKPARPEKAKLEVPPLPPKPPQLQAAPARAQAAADTQQRRNFLTILWATPLAFGFSMLAITNLLWLLGFARFMFPNILTEPPTTFKVGFPDDYGPGQVEEKFKAQFGVWVVRHEYEGETQIYALKSVCTHLGCTPNWLEGEQKFKCPCHGSGFYKDGINFEGPAPRPLERYAIRIADDGQLEVDKSRTFNQELGQWNNAASFVPV